MTEQKKALADILFQAISAENDGRNLYLMAASQTADLQAKEVFTRLADEELSHGEFLKAQYKSVLETGQGDAALKLGQPVPLLGDSPIFSDSFKSRIKQAHFEMSSLSIALHLEETAMKYYAERAAIVEDPTIKQMFMDLSEWEKGHFQALQRQLDMLKEDYWAGAGFSPF